MCCFVYFSSGRNFIRSVGLRLLSRGTNFHSRKHIRNYTQDRLVNLRSIYCMNSCTCCLFLLSFINFQAELLVFVEEHFDFQPA